MDGKSRGWCFTINNPCWTDEIDLEQLQGKSEYLVYGKEEGENHTPHYQGYVRFKHPTTLNRVSQLLPRAHIEKQKGTAIQAAEYCKKDGDFKEFGEPPKSAAANGARTKEMWRKVIAYAEAGDVERIRDEYPHVFFLHFKRIEQLRLRQLGVMPGDLSNEWWVGETGTGKSRRLWELYPDHYGKQLNKWWDGYKDESVVALEEMDPDHGKFLGHFIKQWADRYPFPAEVKGSNLGRIRPGKIIILSNYEIDECFEREQDRDPIKRRFKVVRFRGELMRNPFVCSCTGEC